MTIRRQGKTALTADQDRHTCFENLAESVGTLDDFLAKNLLETWVSPDRASVIGQVRLERKGRDQRHSMINHRTNGVLIHIGRVQDHVETSEGRIANTRGITAMTNHGHTELMGCIAHQL